MSDHENEDWYLNEYESKPKKPLKAPKVASMKYQTVFLDNTIQVTVCTGCGSCVWDKELHDNHHAKQDHVASQASRADSWTNVIG